MLLILTHENADFDAIASQLAASRLYPEGIPLLPRRVNRNVNQFLTLYWDTLPFMWPKDWQRKRVDRVLVVDTHTVNSVRGMVRRPQVHVIDHHVGHAKQEGWTYHVEAVGATTTLLVEMMKAAGLAMLPEEATLLLLGIYEDTGSLTYATTTSRDMLAAAHLLECGALLGVVRRFMNVALTSGQRQLYDRLQRSATWMEIAGQSIAIAVAEAPASFDEEISSVAHRLRDALSPVALFVLVGLQRDVQLVARSASSFVDVSAVAKELGGGGHERAAAAMLVDQSLDSVSKRLEALLPTAVRPMATVAQIMSYGVQTVSPTDDVVDAASIMQRFGYEGFPVIDPEDDQLVGLLTRRAVDRAMSHGLGNLPVGRIMKAGMVMVRPSDSIKRVQELMLEEGWGQIPVVSEGQESEGGRPIGIVTRTDVLNHLFAPGPPSTQVDMRQVLLESLSPALWGMLLAISDAANELRMPLYFVGGVVRDMLLRQPSSDLDMVVEGDAIRLVEHLQSLFGGEIHTHSRFGTAKWFVAEKVWRKVVPDTDLKEVPGTIDFVTARSEFYTEPTALPEVERGSIKLDLHRRDFTINTLAVRLDGPHLGELLDFYGGRRDLDQGIIRVLHSLSFIDDPTRILRAVRLEQRLGFSIDSRTQELIVAALDMLARVTGSRIRHEIELALRETDPARIVERLADLNVLGHIHHGLEWTPATEAAFREVPRLQANQLWKSVLKEGSLVFVYFALWVAPLPQSVAEDVMERLKVRKATRQDVTAVGRLNEALATLDKAATPSQVAQLMRPHTPRVLLVARALAQSSYLAEFIDRYFSEWRHVKTVVGGDDLRQLGLKPGPEYAVILDRILAAKLDGEVKDEAGERALLARLLAERLPTGAPSDEKAAP